MDTNIVAHHLPMLSSQGGTPACHLNDHGMVVRLRVEQE
jgi:hypothetical protein